MSETVLLYRGRRIEDLSRDQLIGAVYDMKRESDAALQIARADADMQLFFRDVVHRRERKGGEG